MDLDVDSDPETARRIALSLTRVRTPDDALAFVGEYGPLTAPLPENLLWGQDTVRAISELDEPVEIREPLETILQTAQQLDTLARSLIDARKAAEGDNDARDRVVRHLERTWELEDGEDFPEPYETAATRDLAAELRAAVGNVRVHFDTVGPGEIEIRLLCSTLAEFCFLSLARTFSRRDPLMICPACAGVFAVEDARQRYCSPRCGNRERFRRFAERQKSGNKKGKARR